MSGRFELSADVSDYFGNGLGHEGKKRDITVSPDGDLTNAGAISLALSIEISHACAFI